jgi:hypothetical protein
MTAFLRAPLCPAGHLPLKGGDWQLLRRDHLSTLEIIESNGDGRSPPLRGRCPAGQRGVFKREHLKSC